MTDLGTAPIPAAFRGVCELCGHDLDTRKPGIHQWTAGWVMQRTGGGGHGISCAVRESRWAHGGCVDSAARGFTNQTSMFR